MLENVSCPGHFIFILNASSGPALDSRRALSQPVALWWTVGVSAT
jgi:hypothetical protein